LTSSGRVAECGLWEPHTKGAFQYPRYTQQTLRADRSSSPVGYSTRCSGQHTGHTGKASRWRQDRRDHRRPEQNRIEDGDTGASQYDTGGMRHAHHGGNILLSRRKTRHRITSFQESLLRTQLRTAAAPKTRLEKRTHPNDGLGMLRR
jgi:hypothetical protein